MPKETSGGTAFKDQVDESVVDRLGKALASVDATFPAESFRAAAVDGLDQLELKARIAQIAGALQEALPQDFDAAAAVVDRLLLSPGDDDRPAGLTGWDLWPLPEWVALAGRASPEVALELLSRVTKYSSGEFAIRPFIDDDPPGVLERLSGWVERDDEHVRRLVSEGTRPKLPWAPKLAVAADDPGYAVFLLDRLVGDESEYVRRSVSNHLNDLCRADPELALEVAERWSADADVAEGLGDLERAARLRWVVKRGIRTLVKAGRPEAMRLLGHEPDLDLDVTITMHRPTVEMGEHAEWTLSVGSNEVDPHRVLIDYAIHFIRANGSTGRKVFKWTTVDLGPGEQVELSRRHRITPITIRNYYSGEHLVDVQINGVVVASAPFDLVVQ